MLQRTGLSFLSLLVLSLLFALPVFAQTAKVPALFDGAIRGATALNSTGHARMTTLQQDSTTRSIRLVRLVENLSQQRVLTMQVDRGTRALAPTMNPAFQRNSENGGSSGRMVELSIQRDGINALSEGTYAWMGTPKLDGTPVGSVTLIHGAEGEISGTIRLEGEIYKVRPLNRDLHALVEVDESQYSLGGDSPLNSGAGTSDASTQPGSSSESIPASTGEASPSASWNECTASTASLSPSAPVSDNPGVQSTANAPCPQQVADALVVYTSAAASGINIDNRINEAIQLSNNSYNNSNAYNADLTLVHDEQIGFTESGSLKDDVDRLQNNGPVQSLRNQYDADVVVLLGEYGGGGRAAEIRAEAGDAYAIVGVSRAAGGGLVFPHEVGHLQGAQHHPDDPTCTPGTSCDDEGDIISDAFGHRFSDTDCTIWIFDCETDYYASVMAYTDSFLWPWIDNDHTRITKFSNPNVTHDGHSTGTSDRYNADALQTTALTVEDFRISDDLRASMTVSGLPGDSERTFTADVCGGTDSYGYAWRISYNGPGNYGPPVGSGESFTKTFPGGTHYVKLTVSSGSQSDTAVRSVWVKGDCSHPPCPLTTTESASDSLTTKTATTDEAPMTQKPKRVALHGAAPNPFRSSTEIVYALPERTDVRLAVYDLMGRQVATLAIGSRGTGIHRTRLDGASLPSGTYVVRLRAGGQQHTTQVTVVK